MTKRKYYTTYGYSEYYGHGRPGFSTGYSSALIFEGDKLQLHIRPLVREPVDPSTRRASVCPNALMRRLRADRLVDYLKLIDTRDKDILAYAGTSDEIIKMLEENKITWSFED